MIFEWLVGTLTVASFWLAGSDHWHGWLLAIITQVSWIIYGSVILHSTAITTSALIIFVVVIRNAVVTFRRNT